MMASAADLDPIERLIDLDEVLERLGISEKTLRRWIAANEFPKPLRVAGKPRWRARVFNRFVEELVAKQANDETAARTRGA